MDERLAAWLHSREPALRFAVATLAAVAPWVVAGALMTLVKRHGMFASVPAIVAVIVALAGIPLASLVLAEGRARKALASGDMEALAVAALIVSTGTVPTAAFVLDGALGTLFAAHPPPPRLVPDILAMLLWTAGFILFALELTRRQPLHSLALAAVVAPLASVGISVAHRTLWPAPLVFVPLVAAWYALAKRRPDLLTGASMTTQIAPNAPKLTCSFCGKSQVEVKKLVAGPNVYICDECIGLSNDILVADGEKEAQARRPTPPVRADRDALRAALAAAFPGALPVTEALATTLFVHRARAAGAATRPARVLIVGPTGCGKSTLIAAALAAARLPHAHTEATRLTETGYVGECVENLLAELVDAAGSVEAATFGVLAIDGLHHLTRRGPSMTGRDISGGEVQRELLRLLDGRAAPLSYTRPRHPQQEHPRFPADGVLVLAAATVPADAPTEDVALRAWLVDQGYSAELIARFERILFVPALDATRAAARLRAADGPLAPLFALAAVVGVELVVSDTAIDALANRATAAGGGWNVTAAVARLAQRVVEADKRVQLDTID